METTTAISTYYDKYVEKLINDYTAGNPRMISAINFTLGKIPLSTKRILDIGTGLGWSAHEYARKCPEAKIDALDISPGLIAAAKKMFSTTKSISFLVMDVTSSAFYQKIDNIYDVITLIDVYEHIAKSERDGFDAVLNKILGSTGRIIITTPTVFHQSYLRKHNPAGLQPVDEDIDMDVIQNLAMNVRGVITHFEFVSINHQYDYIHICIERGINDGAPKMADRNAKVEPMLSRIIRVLQQAPKVSINWSYTLKRFLRLR